MANAGIRWKEEPRGVWAVPFGEPLCLVRNSRGRAGLGKMSQRLALQGHHREQHASY